jgi:hypothetical protein
MPSNVAFHPTIETVGFQTAFSVRMASISLSIETTVVPHFGWSYEVSLPGFVRFQGSIDAGGSRVDTTQKNFPPYLQFCTDFEAV